MNSQEIRALQEAYSQVYELDENRMDSRMGKMPSGPAKVGKATHSIKDIAPSKEPSSKEKAKARKALGLDEAGTATGPRLTDAYDKPPYGDDLKSKPTKKGPKMKGVVRKEGVDLYDIILSHLLDEGYADTEQAAEAIMVNMSEDWRESIVEGEEKKEEPQKPFTGEGPKKPKGWRPTGPKLKSGQRPGYAR
jgi:hypothetical protein